MAYSHNHRCYLSNGAASYSKNGFQQSDHVSYSQNESDFYRQTSLPFHLEDTLTTLSFNDTTAQEMTTAEIRKKKITTQVISDMENEADIISLSKEQYILNNTSMLIY
jgi:hypothetical protein